MNPLEIEAIRFESTFLFLSPAIQNGQAGKYYL
jgi:hypothetical protein